MPGKKGDTKADYDAVVVGSGPNGLAAAITLQQAGLAVLLLEGKDTIGGGMRTEALTLPGFHHDVCSAIHPLAVLSPFFKSLPLADHGLRYIYPDIPAAHPFDDGTAACLYHGLSETVQSLGTDGGAYRKLVEPLVKDWPLIAPDFLAPLHFPNHPRKMARFGLKAVQSARAVAGRFTTGITRGLWAGMAAHAMQPLSHPLTAAVGLVLMASGHLNGWPLPQGGSAALARALASYFRSLGGRIETGVYVRSLSQLPHAKAVIFDVTPRQLLEIAGHRFSAVYKWQLSRYQYGMGVFKIDWALDGPVPFTAADCRRAGTIHLGNSFEEISLAEQRAWRGGHPERPFVLLAQQTVFDPARAPQGKHLAWAYCHVPSGSTRDQSEAIERQVERFAPGFRDRILARHTMNSVELEAYNPNYVGGDINSGVLNPSQLFTRPALRGSPYRTSAKGIYICSAATPPGGGVHGMCGYHAARRVLRDLSKTLSSDKTTAL